MKNINFFNSKTKVVSFLISTVFLFVFFVSCDEVKDESSPPEIPAYESMAIDFNKFTDNKKSAEVDSTSLESVHKLRVWFIEFEFEACEALKIKEFTFVNDCFQSEHNEEVGLYGQTLV